MLTCWHCSNSNTSTTPEPTLPSPQQQGTTFWWNDRVFYEIFVRSFYDSDGDGIGDLRGIISKLDYLNDGNPNTHTDLGITGIWLMPVNPSPSYHGYDVEDYRGIEADYGTTADFLQLVSEAHKRGIAIIIDFVMNHTSSNHPWFIDSASNTNVVRRNWYRWSPTKPEQRGPWGQEVWHSHGNGGFYYGVFSNSMPDLNYSEPAVRAEMKAITNYWLTTMMVDGFRCDAVKYIMEDGNTLEDSPATLLWWEEFYNYYKGINNQVFTVGEAWDETAVVKNYTGGKLDFCFEFDLAVAILNAVQNESPSPISAKMEDIIDVYPFHQYGTFLSNHDQDRVFSRLSQDAAQVKLAAAVYLTLPGVPFIYYGEEVGMMGISPDEDRRRPMQWNNGLNAGFSSGVPWHSLNTNSAIYNVETEKADNNSIWQWYRTLIRLRHQYVALRQGTYHLLQVNPNVILAYVRQFQNEALVVVSNFSPSERTNITLSALVSNLNPRTYNVVDVISQAGAGTLTVGENGKIENWTPISRLAGRSTTILKLE